MSPEIRINGLIIAKVPDETGIHHTLKGKLLYVNVDGIDADANNQRIILDAEEIGGRRELRLTCEGIGNSSKRAGDKKSPEIDVKLLDRPIRVTYSRQGMDTYGYCYQLPRATYRNPRWTSGNGQR